MTSAHCFWTTQISLFAAQNTSSSWNCILDAKVRESPPICDCKSEKSRRMSSLSKWPFSAESGELCTFGRGSKNIFRCFGWYCSVRDELASIYLQNNLYIFTTMSSFLQHFGMFILGLRDSISLGWIKGILLYTDPQTMRILPASHRLFKTLGESLVQVCLLLTLLPLALSFVGLEIVSSIVGIITLLLTYGYLFFYNNDILLLTKEVVVWKRSRFPATGPELDLRYRVDIFDDLSNQLQSVFFLVLYYVPIYILALLFALVSPTFGPITLVLSQSFFNSAFYFLRKWAYDRYNVGFMEANLAYMVGYGFFVSLVCNLLLPPTLGRPSYFLISQWMIINTVLHSPPCVKFRDFKHVTSIATNSVERDALRNGFNVHRELVGTDEQYRRSLLEGIVLFKPLFMMTEYLNGKVSQMLNSNQSLRGNRRRQPAQRDE